MTSPSQSRAASRPTDGRYAPLLPLRDLKASYVHVTPVDTDWRECNEHGEPRWDHFEARRDDDTGVIRQYADLRDTDTHPPEGPMMAYRYPLPEWGQYGLSEDETASRIVDLPLCLVCDREAGEYALALTGGGMDLSWEICEGFMRLGYLPPVHFASSLPQMAGRGESARDRWIVGGCKLALQTVKNRMGYALRNLRQSFKQGADGRRGCKPRHRVAATS